MDIFESRYFSINTNLLTSLGLWPYESRKKYFIRAIYLFALSLLITPQIISVKTNRHNFEDMAEHLVYCALLLMVFFKFITLILVQNKLQIMYNGIAENWQLITDEEEMKILVRHSENGRTVAIAYMLFIALGYVIFISFPLVPIALDLIIPLSEPRPNLYILNGDYFIEDKDAHYFKIYFWEVLTVTSVTYTTAASDATFVCCIQHCIGLFAILRYRLKKPNSLVYYESLEGANDPHDWMIEIVKLHVRILKFVQSLGDAYSYCFFMIVAMTIFTIPLSSVMVLFNLHNPLGLVRYSIIFPCILIHTLFYCWLGQQISDHSTSLFQDAYCNEWYCSSPRAKGLLRVVMLRCFDPITLSAAGLIDMNLENFQAIMKTSVSYITLCASF